METKKTIPEPVSKPFEPIKLKKVSSIGLIVGTGLTVLSLCIIGILTNLLSQKAKAVQKIRSQILSTTINSQDAAILQKTLEDTKESRERLLAAFPTEESLLKFIELIDTLKKMPINIRFSVDSDIPTKIGRNPSFLPMTLTMQGSRVDIEDALKQISDSPYYIRPVSYSIRLNDKDSKVEVNTQFHLFVSDGYNKNKS